jgi:hypothetical protein
MVTSIIVFIIVMVLWGTFANADATDREAETRAKAKAIRDEEAAAIAYYNKIYRDKTR